MTSKALINYEINHKEYHSLISEETKYRKKKEDIKMIKNEKNDAEKDEINENTENA